MNRKQIAVGLVVVSVISLNTPSVEAVLEYNNTTTNVFDEKHEDEISSDDLDTSNSDINNTVDKDNGESNVLDSEDNTLLDSGDNTLNEEKFFIEIKDENLLKAINLSLNKNDLYSPISIDDIENITTLDLSNSKIIDLSGLEYFKNLQSLDISNNNIIDISNLSNLSNLVQIKALNNNIFDISCLKDLDLIKADFSNQNINLKDEIISDNILNIDNPLKTDNLLDLEYNISDNGIYLENMFAWDNLFLREYNLEILFNGENEVIKFSGIISKNVSNNISVTNDIKVELLPNTLDWVNSDLVVTYKISGSDIDSIDYIELPSGEVISDLTGNFSISSNGNYILKVFFNNGEFIEKNIEIKNIDKDKPLIDLVNYINKDGEMVLKIEATDNLSGIDYILLPNKEKIYKNEIEYSTKLRDCIYIKAFDLAGNYEELKVDFQNLKNKTPILNVSDKTLILGSKFDVLNEVSAKDYNGNDITNNIKVISNLVDIYSLGEYMVTYMVQDFEGNSITKSIIVRVIDKDGNKNNNLSSNNDVLQSLESNISNEENIGNNNLNIKDKNNYSTAIVFSMILGFVVFFKSGKDNF